jgi:CRP-like cAMP-binding protein
VNVVQDSGSEVSLAATEFFRSLGRERLEHVQLQVRERAYPARKVLFREGQPAEFLWAVRRGEVRIVKNTSDGRVMTLETIHPGEIFGAVAALEGSSYPAGAETTLDSVVWRLSRVELVGLVRSDPGLSREILSIVARRLRGAHARLRSIAYDSAEARLAQALLRAVRDGEAHVTRRELAEAAGTTVETAIRVIRRLEREGIVRGEVHHLCILDEPALRRAAQLDEREG